MQLLTCTHMLQEMKQLKPGERVLVIGASSEPYLCAKKDERALMGFFQKHISLPVPDYASRKLLWAGLVERHGATAEYRFDWPTLAQISEGYTSGQIDLVCCGPGLMPCSQETSSGCSVCRSAFLAGAGGCECADGKAPGAATGEKLCQRTADGGVHQLAVKGAASDTRDSSGSVQFHGKDAYKGCTPRCTWRGAST
jgi:hypothetical protein